MVKLLRTVCNIFPRPLETCDVNLTNSAKKYECPEKVHKGRRFIYGKVRKEKVSNRRLLLRSKSKPLKRPINLLTR